MWKRLAARCRRFSACIADEEEASGQGTEGVNDANKLERVHDLKRFRATRVSALHGCLPQDPNSFHRAVTPLLLVGRTLSVLPLQGVLGADVSMLRFRWCSVVMVYTLTVLVGYFFMLWSSIKKNIFTGWTFEDPTVVFFSLALAFTLIFVDLARKWPQLAQEWQSTEQATAHNGSPSALSAKVKTCTVFMVIATNVEYMLNFTKRAIVAMNCTDGSLLGWMDFHFHAEYPQVFMEMPYSAWAGILVTITNCSAHNVWNYADMFIIIISMVLVDRFKLLNARLNAVRGKARSEDFWRQMREDYNNLSWLCLSVDKTISKLVLLSFTSNVYFICLQLYNSIRPMNQHATEIVYFYYSIGFLLLRSILVAVSAAAVNDESKEPKSVLFSVPSVTYSVEVQRFLFQVTFDDVVLTGMNFFSVTRSLLLTVAGTIVTYEIFLIQFNSISADTNQMNNGTFRCSMFHWNTTTSG